MTALPFVVRRPWLLVHGTLANRDRPNLTRLRSMEDPERFVWAILPHGARTFAASIAMLPAAKARTAAVAYLYCRMLDTYEDLHPDPHAKQVALGTFATRLGEEPMPDAPALPGTEARDQRDLVHLLLVDRCALVDRVFESLPPEDQKNINKLVRSMAGGMRWSAEAFQTQGGVLLSDEQLDRYCHNVIGEPALFTIRLLVPGPISEAHRRDAMRVSEMIQLANVTRDIERDLERGIAYHRSLKPFLGRSVTEDAKIGHRVREVRRELLLRALQTAPAYRRLVEELDLPPVSTARASAVLMLLFTDRYYRSCTARIDGPVWRGPTRTSALVLSAAMAAVSPRWATRVMARVEDDFRAASLAIGGAP